DGFIAVDNLEDVVEPERKHAQGDIRGPKKAATDDHDQIAPPDRKILKLFDEVVTAVLRLFLEEPVRMALEELPQEAFFKEPSCDAEIVSECFNGVSDVV